MCRTTDLIGRLSPAERASLLELGREPARARIPFAHAETLLRYGLAELVCGSQALTRQGKRAVGLLRH